MNYLFGLFLSFFLLLSNNLQAQDFWKDVGDFFRNYIFKPFSGGRNGMGHLSNPRNTNVPSVSSFSSSSFPSSIERDSTFSSFTQTKTLSTIAEENPEFLSLEDITSIEVSPSTSLPPLSRLTNLEIQEPKSLTKSITYPSSESSSRRSNLRESIASQTSFLEDDTLGGVSGWAFPVITSDPILITSLVIVIPAGTLWFLGKLYDKKRKEIIENSLYEKINYFISDEKGEFLCNGQKRIKIDQRDEKINHEILHDCNLQIGNTYFLKLVTSDGEIIADHKKYILSS